MSRICEVTGTKRLKGLKRSHALNSSIKFQNPNLQKKRFWVPGENRWITLKLSTKALRTIDKKGINEVLKEIKS